MLCIDPVRRAIGCHTFDEFVPPMVTPGLHRHRRTGSSQHDDVANARAALGQRFVGSQFQFDDIAAAPPAISGDHTDGACVFDAIFE